MSMKRFRSFNNPLFYIILLGFFVRLTFLLWGADLYYGSGNQYTNGDSFSYSQSFLNLYEKGIFSFDLANADAYFGRLPGYPLFWGAHYLLFDINHVYQAVAVSQLLLDCVAIALVFLLTYRISKNKLAAFISAFVYATYPFILAWIPVTGTELLASFLTILFFYWLICRPISPFNTVVLGVLLACCFYVREYLGILLLSGYLYLYRVIPHRKQFIRQAIWLSLSFGSLYALWPLRNYVNLHR
jgi:hypothetical protein